MRVADIEPDEFEALVRLPEIGHWFTESGDASEYRLARVADALYGSAFDATTLFLYAAQPINSAAMIVHVAAHPARRAQVALAAQAGLARLKARAGEYRLFALTPADNAASIALQRLLGWRHAGTLEGAYLRREMRVNLEMYQCS